MSGRFRAVGGWDDALLTTSAGTLAYFDTTARRIRHGKPEKVPRNLVLRCEGNMARLLTPSEDGTRLLSCIPPNWDAGPCRLEPLDHPFRFIRSDPAIGRIALLHAGAAVQAERNGRLSLLPEGEVPAQLFAATTQRARAIADALMHGQWLDADTAKPARMAAATVPFGSGAVQVPALSLGKFVVDLAGVPGPFVAEPPGAGTSASHVRLVHIAGQGGRLRRLVRYRPVICFAIFGSDRYYDCLSLALHALHRFGLYDGDICIAADRPRGSVAKYIPDAYRHNWIYAAGDPHSKLFSRFNMEDWHLEAFQPVLYMDVDVVANAPLEPLLRQLALSDRVHVATENRLLPKLAGRSAQAFAATQNGNWFGTWLTEGDARFRSKPFALGSSGILGFAHIDIARSLFAVVRTLRRTADPALIASFTDQALVNYALHAIGGGNFDLLDRFTDFVRGWGETPTERLGLVHFHSGVGDAEGKHAAMTRYLEQIGFSGHETS